MDQGWVGYIKLSKDVPCLDCIYEVKEGWINQGLIYQVLGLIRIWSNKIKLRKNGSQLRYIFLVKEGLIMVEQDGSGMGQIN